MTERGERAAGGDDRAGLRSRPPALPTGRSALRIREGTLADLETVVVLRLALLREHAANRIYSRLRPDAPQRARRLFAAQLASPQEVTFLAERGGDVVGILRCVESAGSPLLFPDRYGYVSSVYVRPEARRGGVLKQLLAAAERWCRQRGLDELRLHSTIEGESGNRAWSALGFEVAEYSRTKRI